MKAVNIIISGFVFFTAFNTQAQTISAKSDVVLITETLMDYIEGTAN